LTSGRLKGSSTTTTSRRSDAMRGAARSGGGVSMRISRRRKTLPSYVRMIRGREEGTGVTTTPDLSAGRDAAPRQSAH
jgi:hypothetical protein